MMAILTPDQVLVRGLKKLHVTEQQMGRRLHRTNVADFAACYGPPPVVVAELWRLLHIYQEMHARKENSKKTTTVKCRTRK